MDTDDIIAEVAKRQRIVLAKTDPVMVMATIAELQIEDGRKQLAKVVTEALDQTSASTEQQVETARKVGEAIITSSAQWAGGEIRRAGQDAAERMRTELEYLEARMRRMERMAVYAAVVSVFAVALLVGAAVGYLLV